MKTKKQLLENYIRMILKEELSGTTNSIKAKLKRAKIVSLLESLLDDVVSEVSDNPGPKEYTEVGRDLQIELGKVVNNIVNDRFQGNSKSNKVNSPGITSGMSFRDI